MKVPYLTENFQPVFGNLAVVYSGWWLPRSFWLLKAILMAMRLIFLPPTPPPNLVILDTHPFTLFLLNKFSRYKTIYLKHCYDVKHMASQPDFTITSDLCSARCLCYANKIVVLNRCLGDLFKKSYPKIKNELIYLSPSVDSVLWKEGKIDINRIVPDLPENPLMFVSFGQYTRDSNFTLAIKSFENLLLLLDNALKQRLHLVIGGTCRNDPEQIAYYNELRQISKGKHYASQISFLKETPIAHKKTLIEKSLGVLFPAVNDLFPENILAAMRLGRPIISTNTGFAQEVLTHRLSGVLVEPEPHNFASAMYKVVANPAIQMFVSDMAKDIYKRQYSFETITRNIQCVVHKCIECGEK